MKLYRKPQRKLRLSSPKRRLPNNRQQKRFHMQAFMRDEAEKRRLAEAALAVSDDRARHIQAVAERRLSEMSEAQLNLEEQLEATGAR